MIEGTHQNTLFNECFQFSVHALSVWGEGGELGKEESGKKVNEIII